MNEWEREWHAKRELKERLATINVKVVDHTDYSSKEWSEVSHYYCAKCGTLLGKGNNIPTAEHPLPDCFEGLVGLVQTMRSAMLDHKFISDQPFDRDDND